MLGKPSSKTEIADEAACSDEAVMDACRRLSRPEFNLVIGMPNGRHPVWMLTPNAKHFLSPIVAGLTAPEVSPLAADSTGSCSSLSLTDIESITTTTTALSPLAADSGPKTIAALLPNPHEALVKALTDTGASPKRARRAIATAVRRGETADDIAAKISAGQRYRKSPAGRSIITPYWLTACIEDGRAIPDGPPEHDPAGLISNWENALRTAYGDDTDPVFDDDEVTPS